MDNFIIEKRFIKEAELKNKLGFEKDLMIYSLPYTQDFIKKVKEQRKKFAAAVLDYLAVAQIYAFTESTWLVAGVNRCLRRNRWMKLP